ncbi:hypothetical protein ACP70R_003757 [Stipagrostis hirtigluma subsp. patula]
MGGMRAQRYHRHKASQQLASPKMGTPNAGSGPLEVVIVYAFDSTTATPAYRLVDEVYWFVQDKIGSLASSSRLSYIFVELAKNSYTCQKRFARSREEILAKSCVPCTKNMACGLPEAHRLIGQKSENPNGIILLLSDGLINKGDFFDGAEDFASAWPVYTFTVGGDAYNQGLRTIAAKSQGGKFNPLTVPSEPRKSVDFSLYLDGILGTIKDDKKPPSLDAAGSGLVDEVYWLVQDKIGDFARSSRLSYIYVESAKNCYTYQKRFARSRKEILAKSCLPCMKTMACGLPEAHRLISQNSEHPNGIILLLSDGLINKGDFFEGAEDFASTWPVHTFTIGGDAYNQGLRAIAAKSKGGKFNPLPVPSDPRESVTFSLYLDDILGTTKYVEKPPSLYAPGSRPLEVVILYAFDSTTATPAYRLVDQVYWFVQEKIGDFASSSRLSYIYVESAKNSYTYQKRFARSRKAILATSCVPCTKTMACGLPEAHRLISQNSEHPNGIILLLSDGLINKGDFFEGAEDFASTWPVHTFTVGGDAYNQGLHTIAAKSPGGKFNPVPVPSEPRKSVDFSLYLDDILGTMRDDEKPPSSDAADSSARFGLVTMKRPTYSKYDVALTADSLTVGLELNAASPATAREALDLVVVLDIHSGWEGGDIKLSKVKKAMEFVITKLTPMDRLSIVTKGPQDGLSQCPLRCMTPAGQTDLKALINGLAGPSVDLKEGLMTALAVIRNRVHTEGRTANIFLVTDDGEDSGDARSVDPGNVAVHTFGFGKKAGHEVLKDIAKRSLGGTYSFVPDDSSLCEPFSLLLGGLLTVVAQDVQLTLRSKGEDVNTKEVSPGVDYNQTATGENEITISFGAIFAGESRKVGINLTLNASRNCAGLDAAIAEAELSYNAQGGLERQQPPLDIQIRRTAKPTAAPTADAARLHAEEVRRRHADRIREATALADGGRMEEARRRLQDGLDAVGTIVLDDGERMAGVLRAELQRLIRLMESKELFQEQGRPYAFAVETSHGRQRAAAKGGDDAVACLYVTPRMAAHLKQAKQFEKEHPNTAVPSADEDLKQEIAANRLAAVLGPLGFYLDNAIKSLQAINKIIVPNV